MEYERISVYEKNIEVKKIDAPKVKCLDFLLKALDNQEFEMPAVCH